MINKKKTLKYSHFLAAFAAGTLLGTVFLNLFPEAVEESKGEINIFLYTLSGFLIFFLLERFIHYFHHHQHEYGEETVKPTVSLIIVGDSVHNFIDGIVIATSFLISVPLGIITALAVAAHEIPQEIGDFGILLHKGVRRRKVLFLNLLSSLSALAAALITYWLGGRIESLLPILLALTAGFFIYIAASDIIPEIHNENRKGFAFIETTFMLIGVAMIWIFTTILD